jgi:hypothetical protein
LKVPLSKSGVVKSHRGFESHPLRQRQKPSAHVALGFCLFKA